VELIEPGASVEQVDAILFDLDDTLYDQQRWLDGAWAAVAEAARPYEVVPDRFLAALHAVAAEGSDRGRIIDRALARIGAHGVPIRPLVLAFGSYDAPPLDCYPGVVDALASLRRRVAVGLVSNGNPRIQHSKLHSLGLAEAFDVVVLSDAMGREYRKPHPAPFTFALESLHVPPARAVYVGDRPEVDVLGAANAGMRAIRVRTGEYAKDPDHPAPWAAVPDAFEAIRFVQPFLARIDDDWADAEPTPRRRSTGAGLASRTTW
jgi:putative hydrolase of the HAD superfamily